LSLPFHHRFPHEQKYDRLPIFFCCDSDETDPRHKNLYKHPDIDFTLGDFEEDYSIFAQGQRNKLLPTKAQLEKHKEQIASSVRKNNVKLMGLKNPIIAMYPLSYYSIFFIKRIKLILMLRMEL